MVDVIAERDTTAPPERVLDTWRTPSPEERGAIWSNIKPGRFTLHDCGDGFIEVTEGTLVVGEFWERCRYDWSEPGRVRATVINSNVFRPESFTELRAKPLDGGGSRVELIVNREFQGGKGWIAGAVNHLGGRRIFGWYLGTALRNLEKQLAEGG